MSVRTLKSLLIIPSLILGLIGGGVWAGGRRSTAGAETAIRRILNEPENRTCFWGVTVLDLKTGRPLVAINPDHLFVPASIMKIITSFAALNTYPREYRFSTDIATTGKLDDSGILDGPLIIQGGGDPSWSFEFDDEDWERPVKQFVDELIRQTGIQRINGDIIADDTRFMYKPYGPSWSWEVFQWRYGNKVSALSLNDNVMRLQILPGKSGQPVTYRTYPDFYMDDVHCTTITRRNARLRDLVAYKPFDSDTFYLGGLFPASQPSWNLKISVSDPARYAGEWIRRELEQRGVTVTGTVRVRHRTHYKPLAPLNGPLTRLAAIQGRPLGDILEHTLKKSINLYAELLLRNMGADHNLNHEDERQAGIDYITRTWPRLFTADRNIQMADGSGLSRRNLITPTLMCRVLEKIHAGPNADLFRDMLPISGRDGTLKNRLGGRLTGRIFGKTGLVEQVSSMAGYIHTRRGRWLAFCIVANNHPNHKADAPGTIDRMVKALYQSY